MVGGLGQVENRPGPWTQSLDPARGPIPWTLPVDQSLLLFPGCVFPTSVFHCQSFLNVVVDPHDFIWRFLVTVLMNTASFLHTEAKNTRLMRGGTAALTAAAAADGSGWNQPDPRGAAPELPIGTNNHQ